MELTRVDNFCVVAFPVSVSVAIPHGPRLKQAYSVSYYTLTITSTIKPPSIQQETQPSPAPLLLRAQDGAGGGWGVLLSCLP